MKINFELTEGRNRALVCYLWDGLDFDAILAFQKVEKVFNDQNIAIDSASCFNSVPLQSVKQSLNIALSWSETSRRLRVGGTFTGVCVGVFFYDASQPIDTRGTMAEINEFFGEEVAPEPPSITSLVCDALRETFGGVYGASAFVIPDDITSYTLEVE